MPRMCAELHVRDVQHMPKIAVWHTEHEIASTVGVKVSEALEADALIRTDQLSEENINSYDIHIGYGILRGMADVFSAADKAGKPWFNIDRGYWQPGHYNGYYRISLRGTQQTYGLKKIPADMARFNSMGLTVDDWRGLDYSKPVLICPPTEYVKGFFSDIDGDKWIQNAIKSLNGLPYKVRTKEMSMKTAEPDMLNSNFLLTFNCSLGWKAMRAGIPCMSDLSNSTIGRYYGQKSLDELSNEQYKTRQVLFALMANLQLTLDEMKEHLWPLLARLLSL